MEKLPRGIRGERGCKSGCVVSRQKPTISRRQLERPPASALTESHSTAGRVLCTDRALEKNQVLQMSISQHSKKVRSVVERTTKEKTREKRKSSRKGPRPKSGNADFFRPQPKRSLHAEKRREEKAGNTRLPRSPAAHDERYAGGDAHARHGAPVGQGERLFQGRGALERDRLREFSACVVYGGWVGCVLRLFAIDGFRLTSVLRQSEEESRGGPGGAGRRLSREPRCITTGFGAAKAAAVSTICCFDSNTRG